MNRIRARLHEVVEQTFAAAPERRKFTTAAVNQILDIDLAIMLDTYRLDSEEKQRAAERLVTIGQLAASIGHELRNPLATIESSLYLMNQHMTRENVRDPELEKHLGKIWKQVQHCGQTITNLLDLARDRPPHRREHSLRQIVEQSLERTALSDAVRVEVQVPPALKVFADGDDLSLILVNLLANANQAITGPGQIIIRGGAYKGGTEIYVEDDGPGIAPEIRSKVFEALFTTRARGTGLGLALCMRIVDAHHGELSLEPSQGGAIFRIWLPDRAKPID